MADGGASTFIFLATALLVSGAVSAVLITNTATSPQLWNKNVEKMKRTRKHRLTMLEIYPM